MSHANKDGRTDLRFILLTRTNVNTKTCSEMAQPPDTSSQDSRSGHGTWLARQDARGRRRWSLSSGGSLSPGTSGAGGASDFRVLLRIERGDGHLLEVAVVPALVVTHQDLGLHVAARGHVGAGRGGGVHRQGQALPAGRLAVPRVPGRVGGVGFSARDALAGACLLRFGHVDGVEIGQILVQVKPRPVSGRRTQAARSGHVSGRVYGLELFAELWWQRWQFVGHREVLWRGREIAFDVVTPRVIVCVDGMGVCGVQGRLLVDDLVIGELLNVWQGNAGHPVRCVPVVACGGGGGGGEKRTGFRVFFQVSAPWGECSVHRPPTRTGLSFGKPRPLLCRHPPTPARLREPPCTRFAGYNVGF